MILYDTCGQILFVTRSIVRCSSHGTFFDVISHNKARKKFFDLKCGIIRIGKMLVTDRFLVGVFRHFTRNWNVTKLREFLITTVMDYLLSFDLSELEIMTIKPVIGYLLTKRSTGKLIEYLHSYLKIYNEKMCAMVIEEDADIVRLDANFHYQKRVIGGKGVLITALGRNGYCLCPSIITDGEHRSGIKEVLKKIISHSKKAPMAICIDNFTLQWEKMYKKLLLEIKNELGQAEDHDSTLICQDLFHVYMDAKESCAFSNGDRFLLISDVKCLINSLDFHSSVGD